MKKVILLLIILIGGFPLMKAQNTVTVDASLEILGYMNVFETPANGGGYVFGEPWGVPDLKTVVDVPSNTFTLQPNFNVWNPDDPFWVDPVTGEGNKLMEASTYVEDGSLVGSELTFEGGTLSHTIDPGYEVIAFIKVFNADFSVQKIESTTLTEGENFSITYTAVEPEDTHLQYGFQVTGINANPDDEGTLGSVVVGSSILGTNDFDSTRISVYPNPVFNNLNINSEYIIKQININNVLGQQVIKVTPDSLNSSIDMSSLNSGIYFVDINTVEGNRSIKLIKN
jgi:hypothetical protein